MPTNTERTCSLAPMPEILDALRLGRPVLVTDDSSRENEGDAIMSAALATPAWVAWMVRYTSGYLCAPMPDEFADRLGLPLMVTASQDSRRTAYTITVDAAKGITTGISASDRAKTLNILADPAAKPADLIRPGHIVPLRAREGGVLQRDGHTEAAVDLMRLAGLAPVGVIGELIRDEDGEMMRFDEVNRFGLEQSLLMTTVAEIATYVRTHGYPGESAAEIETRAAAVNLETPKVAKPITCAVSTKVPTRWGMAEVRGYNEAVTGHDHVAVVFPAPVDKTSLPLVRVHSECLTGEALGSLKCECGPQLQTALEQIAREGGALIYMRGHEGRGIGLINKLRAYALQEAGLDTVAANVALGLPSEARDFAAAASILTDLGFDAVRVLTNNPLKISQLEEYGVKVSDRVPLVVGLTAENEKYLEAKRDLMGHVLPDSVQE